MDSITQGLLGAVVAQAGFGKKLGPRAMIVGALCGVLPDLDVVSGAFGPWASMIHHRGITHSVFFAAAMAPLLGWAAWRANGRKSDVRTWAHLSFWSVVTHPLLDLFTSYGTQLLAPFSDRRFAIDAIPIVDPIYSVPLLLSVMVGLMLRRNPRTLRLVGAGALVFTTAYLLFGWSQSLRVQSLAKRQLADEGFVVEHLRLQPVMLVWMWRVSARDAQGNLRVGVMSTWRPAPIAFERVDRPSHPLVDQALASEHGQVFRWFADEMIGVRVETTAEGTSVFLDDQRYGSALEPTRTFWCAHAQFDHEGKLTGMSRERRSMGRLRSELGATWNLMWQGTTPTAVGSAPPTRSDPMASAQP
jgi:inner membrane protein